MLESQQSNIVLARQLFKCAVKADPTSEKSWLVRSKLFSLSPRYDMISDRAKLFDYHTFSMTVI